MKLNLKAFVLTASILWGLALFVTGVGNLLLSGYGAKFLEVMASAYPGYHASGSIGDLIVGTLYALADGAVAGLVFCCLYNFFVSRMNSA